MNLWWVSAWGLEDYGRILHILKRFRAISLKDKQNRTSALHKEMLEIHPVLVLLEVKQEKTFSPASFYPLIQT